MPIDISIIIPCFNRVELLKQTLKSVESAISNLNAEIILVDDGSSPPIADQISEFDYLPLVIIRQNNSGLTTSRYNGLLAAKGNYIQFLDSDDQVTANKFDIQLKEMQISGADVSHTDIVEYHYDASSKKLKLNQVLKKAHYENPAMFYLKVQPVPHSPIFKRAYLLSNISNAFIPLSRNYDSIGEVWYYYNLSVWPAKIIKINEPLTIIIHHDEGRLTDHWELLGLCALSLMNQFAECLPKTAPFGEMAKKMVAVAALLTFRSLPADMNVAFRYAFVDVWEKLGKASIKDLNGGKYFSFLAKMTGPVTAAIIFQKFNHKRYHLIRSIDDTELKTKLENILARVKN